MEPEFPAIGGLSIQISYGLNVQLNWTPSDSTVGGEALSPDYYLLYVCSDPGWGTPYTTLMGATVTNCYTHSFAFVDVEQFLYQVRSFQGPLADLPGGVSVSPIVE